MLLHAAMNGGNGMRRRTNPTVHLFVRAGGEGIDCRRITRTRPLRTPLADPHHVTHTQRRTRQHTN